MNGRDIDNVIIIYSREKRRSRFSLNVTEDIFISLDFIISFFLVVIYCYQAKTRDTLIYHDINSSFIISDKK